MPMVITSKLLNDPQHIDMATDRAAREVMTRVLKRMRDTAASKAPPTVGATIKVTPVVEKSPGVYEGTLTMLRKYWPVETGSGIYGPLGLPYTVVPTRKKALLTEKGEYFTEVTILGQVGKHFIAYAVKKHKRELSEFFSEVTNDLRSVAASRFRG